VKQDKKVDLQLLRVLVHRYCIERVGIGMLSLQVCNDASASPLHGEVALVCHRCMKGWVFTWRVGGADVSLLHGGHWDVWPADIKK